MASRIMPVSESEATDPGVKERLSQAREGWWQDTQMFGVIGRVPSLLNSIVPVIFCLVNDSRKGFAVGGDLDLVLPDTGLSIFQVE